MDAHRHPWYPRHTSAGVSSDAAGARHNARNGATAPEERVARLFMDASPTIVGPEAASRPQAGRAPLGTSPDGRATRSPATLTAAGAAGLAGLVLLSFFLDLGRAYFWDPGEGRYAESVREMLITGDWLRPTLNFAPYFDKPPGFYWLVAGCFRLFGVTEWAARLPSVVSAVLTIVLTVWFAWRRCGRSTALGAGVILATAAQFVFLGRTVRMDMPLTLVMSGTLFHAYALWEDEQAPTHRRYTWPLFVLPAAGLLLKGPVAVLLPLLVVLALCLFSGEWRRLRRFRPGLGLAAAVVLASSWYVGGAIFAPDYLWAFLWQHNLGRFVGAPLAGHRQPFWYYFWVLPLTFLPWTLLLPGALRRALTRARRGREVEAFLLLWIAVMFLFFTASRAKLATYLLPVFPPLAILVSAYTVSVLRARYPAALHAFRTPLLLWSIALSTLAFGVPLAILIQFPAYAKQSAVTLVLAIFPFLGWMVFRHQVWRAVPLLVLLGAIGTQVLFYRAGSPVVNELSSWRAAAEAARDLPPDTGMFAFKTGGHSFSFYLGRTVTSVRSPERVAEALNGPAAAGVLTKRKYFERLTPHLTRSVCVWWENAAGRALLVNRRPAGAAGGAVLGPLHTADEPPPATSSTDY